MGEDQREPEDVQEALDAVSTMSSPQCTSSDSPHITLHLLLQIVKDREGLLERLKKGDMCAKENEELRKSVKEMEEQVSPFVLA